VLTVRPKVTELNFNLFSRCVHPELFEICKSRDYERGAYRLHLDITRDGHLIRFSHSNVVITEVNASAFQLLPELGNVISHPIQRSRSNLTRIGDVRYLSTVELEPVSPQLFVAIEQQLDARLEYEGLVHRFDSNGRSAIRAMSYMHVQSFQNHVLIRALHTFPDTFAVMKSESRFHIQDGEA
jgi:sorbitol-specific phosphotransferase system component IIA